MSKLLSLSRSQSLSSCAPSLFLPHPPQESRSLALSAGGKALRAPNSGIVCLADRSAVSNSVGNQSAAASGSVCGQAFTGDGNSLSEGWTSCGIFLRGASCPLRTALQRRIPSLGAGVLQPVPNSSTWGKSCLLGVDSPFRKHPSLAGEAELPSGSGMAVKNRIRMQFPKFGKRDEFVSFMTGVFSFDATLFA